MAKKKRLENNEYDPEYDERRRIAKIFTTCTRKFGTLSMPLIESKLSLKQRKLKSTKEHSVKNSNKQPKGGGKKK